MVSVASSAGSSFS